MKATKILSFVLAIISLCAVLSSCGNVVTVKNVSFAAITEDPYGNQTLLVDILVGDVNGTSEDLPTVLEGVIALLEENGVSHKADERSITSISSKSEKTTGGYFYVWEYTINGEEPEGRAADIQLHDDDHIVYYYRPTADKTASADDDGEADTAVETEAAE